MQAMSSTTPAGPETTARVYMSSPDVGELEETFALDAIRSGWIAPLGPHVDAFETELAHRCGRSYAVALSSGTAALHLGLLELGVGPGCVVIVPTMTFVATANAVLYTGATPVFVDCDPATGNLDPALLDHALRTLLDEGRRVGAVVTVDLLGRCADHRAILPLCASHGVPVIEDAAEALGAHGDDGPAGSFGEAAILSFNGNKIMTTSGGGALLTDSEELAARVRYRSTQARQPVTHYEHTEVGYNYRMSNILAAVGRAQLQRLDEMIERRRAMRAHYAMQAESTLGVRIFQAEGDNSDNCWLTALLVDPEVTGWTPAELMASLAEAEIESRPLWKPMHQQPLFAAHRAFLNGASDELFGSGLTLPSGSNLEPAQIARIDAVLSGFLSDSA